MTMHRYLVEVETERESGKFASRDEIGEVISEAIADLHGNVDLSGLGADGDSVYEIVSIGITELDNKELKALNKDSENRVREELPGDKALRAELKNLRAELKAEKETVAGLGAVVKAFTEEREQGKTRVFFVEDHRTDQKQYLPDGQYDRIRYQLGEHYDEYIEVHINPRNQLELRAGCMGLAVHPQSGNALALSIKER